MLTIAEMEIAARMNGMEYGKYSNLLENGLATLPPMEEIRAQMVKPKRRSKADAAMQPVVCYDFDGEFVKVYPSVAVAAELLGKSRSMIRYALSGRARSAHGFQWRYDGDPPPGKYVKEVQSIKIPSKRALVDKVCEVCGKPFKGTPATKFCSDACRVKAQKIRKSDYMRKYRHSLKGKTLTCKECGNKFVSNGRRTTFCSEECRKKYHWRAQGERRQAVKREEKSA